MGLEHYVLSGLDLCLCFRTYAYSRPDAKFVTTLNCFASRLGEVSTATSVVGPFNFDSVVDGEESPDDKIMLVPIIKFSETPEGVFLITSSHVIGLTRFDEFECGRGDSLCFAFEELPVVFWSESAKNWPGSVPVFAIGSVRRPNDREWYGSDISPLRQRC